MADKAILMVDDESHILNSLRRLLRKEPYDVHIAVGGRAGLDVLEQQEVQMVISDQRMPEMTGTQFLSRVKERCPDTIRCVLSGYAEAQVIVDAINEGEIYRFIAKPWKDDELKLTIRQCLEQWDIIQENRRLTEQSERQLEQLIQLNEMLETSVEERTQSLQFSQEVLENMPLMVLGISLEGEVVLTNGTAREGLPRLRNLMPGTDIAEILPAVAVDAIRSCLTETRSEVFTFDWEGRSLRARTSQLGAETAPRGCVLLLEADES